MSTKLDLKSIKDMVAKFNVAKERIEGLFNDYEFECEDMKLVDLRNALDTAIDLASLVLNASGVEDKPIIDEQKYIDGLSELSVGTRNECIRQNVGKIRLLNKENAIWNARGEAERLALAKRESLEVK